MGTVTTAGGWDHCGCCSSWGRGSLLFSRVPTPCAELSLVLPSVPVPALECRRSFFLPGAVWDLIEIMCAKWLQRVDDLLWREVVAKGSLCGTSGKLLKLSVLEVPHLRAHGGSKGVITVPVMQPNPEPEQVPGPGPCLRRRQLCWWPDWCGPRSLSTLGAPASIHPEASRFRL